MLFPSDVNITRPMQPGSPNTLGFFLPSTASCEQLFKESTRCSEQQVQYPVLGDVCSSTSCETSWTGSTELCSGMDSPIFDDLPMKDHPALASWSLGELPAVLFTGEVSSFSPSEQISPSACLQDFMLPAYLGDVLPSQLSPEISFHEAPATIPSRPEKPYPASSLDGPIGTLPPTEKKEYPCPDPHCRSVWKSAQALSYAFPTSAYDQRH